MAAKKELRALYKKRRSDISPSQSETLSRALALRVAKSAEFARAGVVHLFLSIRRRNEPDTFPLLDAVFSAGKTAVVSVADLERGTMNSYALGMNDTLVENAFGIPEPARTESLRPVAPSEIDLVFVPLLAYDRTGHRVGYGRGFYDRFLRQCRSDAVKAGLSFFPPEETPIADISPGDIPLDCCFTPDSVLIFNNL